MLPIQQNPLVQSIHFPFLKEHDIILNIKREDLIHPTVSGNKWRKLKLNLLKAKNKGYQGILTFGGAFSNHIFASAAAARALQLDSIGIIRGEEADLNNPTLAFAQNQGMRIIRVARSEYKQKQDPSFLSKLQKEYPGYLIIPEGGTNSLAVEGVAELVSEVKENYDYWVTSVGTGGTLAGIVSGLKGKNKVIGFSSLKGAHSLEKEVAKYISYNNWSINHDYHFGGYGKFKSDLIAFIHEFKKLNQIQLDPIYTGKMMFGLAEEIKKGAFKRGASILAIHTGGLQGIEGFNKRYGNLI